MFFTLFYVIYGVGKYLVGQMQANLTKMIESPKENAQEAKMPEKQRMEDCYRGRRNSAGSDEGESKIKFSPVASVQRYRAVERVLRQPTFKINKVVEFGCSGLKFARNIKNSWSVEKAIFVDIDRESLDEYKFRIEPKWEDYECLRERPLTMEIYEGSVTEYNKVLDDTDAVVCIELIEHLYMPDVGGMETNIFGNIQPKVVIVTTPNKDFNVVFNMQDSEMRHWDHKFEWTRKEFQDWANSVIEHYPNYEVNCETIVEGPIGSESFGGCSQMAVFTRNLAPKTPVTVEHGEYKLVHEQQVYPYFTDELLHENIINFVNEREAAANDCGGKRKYFLTADKLKKSRVQYDSFNLYELKSSIHHKVSNNRLFDTLTMLGVTMKRYGKEIVLPYIEGEVEYEDESENVEDEESETIEKSWDAFCDKKYDTKAWAINKEEIMKQIRWNEGRASRLVTISDESSSNEDDEFDYVTSNYATNDPAPLVEKKGSTECSYY